MWHERCWIGRIKWQADFGFPRKSILFPWIGYHKKLSIHVHCMWLSESTLNKWVERLVVRGGWRSPPGLICDFSNLVGKGNFTFVREKSGNLKILWLWQPWLDSKLKRRNGIVQSWVIFTSYDTNPIHKKNRIACSCRGTIPFPRLGHTPQPNNSILC